MMPARRRGLLLAVLTATVLFCGACTEPTIHTTYEISGFGISGPEVAGTEVAGPEVAGTEVAGPEMTRSAQPDPQQSKSYLSQGNRFLASREPDLAMKAFLGSMSVDGISAEAMTGAGIAAQQLGLLKAARRYLTQASELDPGSVAAHNNLGVVLYKMKEYYTARNEFRSAFAISSGKSEMAALNLNRAEATIASIEEIP